MPEQAMRFNRILGNRAGVVFVDVDLLSYKPQMAWIDAALVAANVIRHIAVFGNLAGQYQRCAMSLGIAAHPERAIPTNLASLPLPTFIGPTLIDLRPEASFDRIVA